MRLVLISDTHERHNHVQIPDGDILVHAGDLTYRGDFQNVLVATNWLRKQPHKHKIFIAGNHDFLFERESEKARELTDGLIYLENSEVTVEGLKFWGSPITPRFFDWAFNCDRADIFKYWNEIPDDTDVLITHGPPMGILDQSNPTRSKSEHLGCFDLLGRVLQIGPKVHVFGHIHGGYGHYQRDKTQFYNASVVNEAYQVRNEPWVVEI